MDKVNHELAKHEEELDAVSLRLYNKKFQNLCSRRKKIIEGIVWSKQSSEKKK